MLFSQILPHFSPATRRSPSCAPQPLPTWLPVSMPRILSILQVPLTKIGTVSLPTLHPLFSWYLLITFRRRSVLKRSSISPHSLIPLVSFFCSILNRELIAVIHALALAIPVVLFSSITVNFATVDAYYISPKLCIRENWDSFLAAYWECSSEPLKQAKNPSLDATQFSTVSDLWVYIIKEARTG